MALHYLLAKSLADPVLALPRSIKRSCVLTTDILLCIGATYFAYYLRLGYWVTTETTAFVSGFYKTSVISILLALPIFYLAGLYRAIFRYSGLSALTTITKASLIYTVLFSAIFALNAVENVPRTIGLIQPILLLLLIGLSRAIANIWLGGAYLKILRQNNLGKVLIYGAGSAGRQLAAAMANSHEMRVVGYLDDDKSLQGNTINGLTVYKPENLSQLTKSLRIEHVLLALPSVSRARRHEILQKITHAKLRVQTLPGLMDLAHGKITVADLRELDIDDLLSREAIDPDPILLSKNIIDRVVLVTGAGGSIGSELCRQILTLKPNFLILVDHSEADLYKIQQDLMARQGVYKGSNQGVQNVKIVSVLGSVTDVATLRSIFEKWHPHIVYHAAAYKHVPIVEANPFEGVKNNVFGTLALATIAKDFQTPYFVLVSTDKAVRPTNVMGATKRVAELILQSFSQDSGSTIFTMVRFGNVLASSGSVIPKFRQQIKDGGPVTITDINMTRYFMTIPEAAQLIIQAGAIAQGGDVFILDMGSPVRIVDLAKNMIKLSGLQVRDKENPDGDIEIVEIGIRPGEKLYEELLISGNPEKTDHPKIFKSHESFYSWVVLDKGLNELNRAITQRDMTQLKTLLHELVPEYNPLDFA